mmetsp:Transcript_50088/g.122274  ORF Transcript_50088/g.122274 Transcript_50088/m.122274 type:complete len:220 (-) Transcript_50088:125-784(-)
MSVGALALRIDSICRSRAALNLGHSSIVRRSRKELSCTIRRSCSAPRTSWVTRIMRRSAIGSTQISTLSLQNSSITCDACLKVWGRRSPCLKNSVAKLCSADAVATMRVSTLLNTTSGGYFLSESALRRKRSAAASSRSTLARSPRAKSSSLGRSGRTGEDIGETSPAKVRLPIAEPPDMKEDRDVYPCAVSASTRASPGCMTSCSIRAILRTCVRKCP